MGLGRVLVEMSLLRVRVEDQVHCSLRQGRIEMEQSQLGHASSVEGSLVLADVKSQETRRWVIRGCFRGGGWNCRLLEDPMDSLVGLPVLEFLEL